MSDHLKKKLHHLSQTIRGKNKVADAHPLSIYQKLIHNNLSAVISPCFPILRSILNKVQWNTLIDGFLYQFNASYTSYHLVSKHFVEYLTDLKAPPYPFLSELAHYEWLEIAVDTAVLPKKPAPINQDIAKIRFIMLPSARVELYDYAVHLINQSHIPKKTEPTALIVYRPFNQQKIEFMKLNLPSYHCLHFLVHEGLSLKEYLKALREQKNRPDDQHYCEFLKYLYEQSIIQPFK